MDATPTPTPPLPETLDEVIAALTEHRDRHGQGALPVRFIVGRLSTGQPVLRFGVVHNQPGGAQVQLLSA